MKHTRAAAVSALVAVAVVVGSAATAEPVDVWPEPAVVTGTTVWYPGSWIDDGFVIGEAEVFATVDDIGGGDALNDDALDGQFSIVVDEDAYGRPACAGEGSCSFTVERTVVGGDVVLQGPTQVMSGLEVAVEHRYLAEGTLARVLATYRNPTAEPITVTTSAYTNYGSDSATVLEADASGDGAVGNGDRWIVTGDGEDWLDPIVTSHFFGAGATLAPTQVWADAVGYSESVFTLTVAPGTTANLAFFSAITGYVPDGDPEDPEGPGPRDVHLAPDAAGAQVLDTYAAAADAAAASAGAFSGVSGRAVAGIPAGTVLLNWGTVTAPAAPPATPAAGNPSFTG